jgi:threonine aldolase
VGACLAGSRELIDQAWRLKQMMGGALRQAGIVAAAALYALDHNVERLAEDHANARLLADGLAELPSVTIDPEKVETNIVFFETDDAPARAAALQAAGVEAGAFGPRRIRAVTHLDVDRAGVGRALDVMRGVLA